MTFVFIQTNWHDICVYTDKVRQVIGACGIQGEGAFDFSIH